MGREYDGRYLGCVEICDTYESLHGVIFGLYPHVYPTVLLISTQLWILGSSHWLSVNFLTMLVLLFGLSFSFAGKLLGQ